MFFRVALFIFAFSMPTFGQSVDWHLAEKTPDWTSLPEALQEAMASNDKIMVFIYTDWCGYCRRMIHNTFQDAKVLAYLEDKFQSVRINAESSEEVNLDGQVVTESQLAQALGAQGFPTVVFMEPTGKYITHLPGFLEPSDYLCVLSFIGSGNYENQSYAEHLETCG